MKNNYELPSFWVVIPAAGIGSRMCSDIPKQYLTLGSLTVLEHTLACFLDHPKLLKIIICLSKNDQYWAGLSIKSHPLIQVVDGGDDRANSVMSGLISLSGQAKQDDWVLVHDAARPNLTRQDLDKLLCVAGQDSVGGLLAVPSRDTLKQINEQGRVKKTLDRKVIWQALTPQMFRFQQLKFALQQALDKKVVVTDEASAIEMVGHAPLLVEGRGDNLKVTYPEDIQRLIPYFTKSS